MPGPSVATLKCIESPIFRGSSSGSHETCTSSISAADSGKEDIRHKIVMSDEFLIKRISIPPVSDQFSVISFQ